MEDEFNKIDKFRKDALIAMKEVKETCEYVAKKCQENIDILNNPFRFVVEGEKIIENQAKINLRLASLGNFGEAINKVEEGDEEDA